MGFPLYSRGDKSVIYVFLAVASGCQIDPTRARQYFASLFDQLEVYLGLCCFSATKPPSKLYNISNDLGRCGGVVIAQAQKACSFGSAGSSPAGVVFCVPTVESAPPCGHSCRGLGVSGPPVFSRVLAKLHQKFFFDTRQLFLQTDETIHCLGPAGFFLHGFVPQCWLS